MSENLSDWFEPVSNEQSSSNELSDWFEPVSSTSPGQAPPASNPTNPGLVFEPGQSDLAAAHSLPQQKNGVLESVGMTAALTDERAMRTAGGVMESFGRNDPYDYTDQPVPPSFNDLPGTANELTAIPRYASEYIKWLGDMSSYGLSKLAAMATPDDVRKGMRESGQMLSQEATRVIREESPNPDGFGAQLAADVTAGGLDLGLSILAGMATRSPAVAGAVMGTHVYGQSYNDYMDTLTAPVEQGGKGMDRQAADKIASTAAQYKALAEGLTETIPAAAIMKRGGKYAKKLVNAGVTEGIQEAVMSVFEQSYDAAALENMTLAEAIGNIDWSEVAYSALVGGIIGTGLGAMTPNGPEPEQQRGVATDASEFLGADPEGDAPEFSTTGTVDPQVQDAFEQRQAKADQGATADAAGTQPVDLEPEQQNDVTRNGLDAPLGAEPAQPEPVKSDRKEPEQNAVGGLPVSELPVDNLRLSDDVPQFKDGANKDGIVEPLGGSFDRRGVAPIQVWERNDGSLEVISGRHRLDLARRSGERTIPAQVHREADGFDRDQASSLDAELNIRDNQGKAKDYVQYFQTSGITEKEANDRGLLSRALGNRSWTIATQGSEETIAAHRADIISDEAAERVAKTAPKDSKLQAVGLSELQRGSSITNAVNMMHSVSTMGGGDASMDMFGFDDSAIKRARDMAKLATAKQREISEKLRPQKAVSKAGEKASREGIIDNLSADDRKKRIDELTAEREAWENWSTNPDLVASLNAELDGKEPDAPNGVQVDDESVETPQNGLDFGLEQQTEADLKAKQEQQDAAQKAESEAEQKAQADAEVDMFDLTGSDRQRDQNPNQVDLLQDIEKPKNGVATPDNPDHVEVTINGQTDTVNTNISPDQAEAGKYKKAHITINGMQISVETPAGSKRRPEWPALKDHYGDFKRTIGAEGETGEGVDVFINSKATDEQVESRDVFVIDQQNKDGSFDEHKAVLGATSADDALKIYNRNYEKGWTGGGAVTRFTWDEFKAWSKNPENTSRPAEQVTKLIEKYQLPRNTKFEDGRSPLTKGKFRAVAGDMTGNWSVTLDEAAKSLSGFVRSREEGQRETARIEKAEQRIADKLRDGVNPGIAEWKQIFPFLKDHFTYVEQPKISPFLIKYFGFSRAKIRKSLGDAAGNLVSDMGNKKPIVYLNKLAGVLSGKTKPADAADNRGGDKGTVDSKPEEKLSQDKKPSAKPSKKAATAKNQEIDDVGEKLGGAKKDIYQRIQDNLARELSDDDIVKLPLSKIWPKKDIDDIEDDFLAAWAHVARAEIPSKPRSGYKLKGWTNKVKAMRGFTDVIFQWVERNSATASDFNQMAEQFGKGGLKPLVDKVRLLSMIDRSQWSRIGRVVEYPDAYTWEVGDVKTKIPKPQVSVEIDGRFQTFYSDSPSSATVSDQIESIQKALGSEKGGGEKRMKFEIRGRGKKWQINKVGDPEYRALKSFTSLDDARAYLRGDVDHYADLVDAWEATKERDNVRKDDVRNKENRPRTGEDYRNGKDVSPEEFRDTFGFRGVEFGNWVKQGKGGKERQGMINQAYDALMDLANIINVPPMALSLNGTLGLGFGSRGSGKASAHYETGKIVINLTKTRGAGTLAHEWFHALDNYFSRARHGGELKGIDREGNFITYLPEPMMVLKDSPTTRMTRAQLKAAQERHQDSGFYRADRWQLDPNHPDGVRPEVERQFAELVEALDRSPMRKRAQKIDKGKADGYWSRILERAARSFENYIIHEMALRGYDNDYLANVKEWENWGNKNPERYPYLKPDELPDIKDAFDSLFQTIETRETDQGIAMFRQNDSADAPAALGFDFVNQTANRLFSRLGLNKGTKLLVVPTETDLPARIQEQAAKQGATGEIIAVHDNGRIYIVADRATSVADIEESILHEATHFGGEQLFKGEHRLAYNVLFMKMGGIKGLRKWSAEVGIDDLLEPYISAANDMMQRGLIDTARRNEFLVDEFLALAQGQRAYESLPERIKRAIQGFIGRIRDALRKSGFADLPGLAESDLVFLLKKIHDAAATAGRGGARFRPGIMTQYAAKFSTREYNPRYESTYEEGQGLAGSEQSGQTDQTGEIYARATGRDHEQGLAEFQRAKAGEEVTFVHRSQTPKTAFSDDRLGGKTGTPSAYLGHFLAASDIGNPDRYGNELSAVTFQLENPFIITQEAFNDLGDFSMHQIKDLRRALMGAGHDGILIEGLAQAVVFEGDKLTVETDGGDAWMEAQVAFNLREREVEEVAAAKAKGLPMDKESRLERAREMGFDTDTVWAHWTDSEFDYFDADVSGEGIHLGTESAAIDRARGRDQIDYEIEEIDGEYWVWADGGPNADEGQGPFLSYDAAKRFSDSQPTRIEPLKLYIKKGNYIRVPDLGQWAPWEMMRNAPDGMFTKADIDKVMESSDRYASMREAFIQKGVDGVIYQNEVEDLGSDSIIVFSPSQIRSIHAAFDPDYADSPNIMFSRKAASSGESERSGVYSGYGNTSDIHSQGQRDQVFSEPAQYDLFAPAAVPAETAKPQAKDSFNTLYRQVETASYPTAYTKASDPETAAHILAPIRKNAQEGMYALVLDADDNVLGLINHAKGGIDSSSVFPVVLAGAIADTPGAAKVWIAHNHPSGVSDPSRADIQITQRIRDTMEASGISIEGHMVVAGPQGYHLMDDRGYVINDNVTPKPGVRRQSTSIKERVIRKNRPGDRVALTKPAIAKSHVKGLDSESGLLLLNTRNQTIGVINLSPDEMATLRDGDTVPRILSTLSKTNASAAMAFSKQPGASDALSNIGNYLSVLEGGIRHLDTFELIDGDLESWSELGKNLNTGKMFARRADSPAASSVGIPQIKRTTQAYINKLYLKRQIEKVVHPNPDEFRQATGYRGADADYATGYMSGNTIHIIASNVESSEELARTLRHELMGHYGLDVMHPDDKLEVLARLKNSRFIPGIRGVWREVNRLYPDLNVNERAEEVFAKLAESPPTRSVPRWEQIVDLVVNLLRKAGLLDSVTTRTEIDHVLKQLANGIIQRGKPANAKFRAMKVWNDNGKSDKEAYNHGYEERSSTNDPGNQGAVSEDNPAQGANQRRHSPQAVRQAIERNREEAHTEFLNAVDGKPVTLVHRSKTPKTKFDDNRLGGKTGTPVAFLGHYFGTADVGDSWLGNHLSVSEYQFKKPLVISKSEFIAISNLAADHIKLMRSALLADGYDGVLIEGIEYAVVLEGEGLTILDDADIQITGKFRRKDSEGKKSVIRAMLDAQPLDKVFRAPFAPLLDQQGQFKPGVKAEQWVKKKVVDGKTGVEWVDAITERFRHGLIDRYKTPQDFIDREQETLREQRAQEMKAVDFIKGLSEHITDPKEWAMVKAMLEGEDVGEKSWSNLAEPIRRAIDEMGQDAVNLGLITAETYERNKGAYLHRVYRKHEAQTTSMGKLAARVSSGFRKKIQGDALKRRGMSFNFEQDRLFRDFPAHWFGLTKTAKKADKSLINQEFVLLEMYSDVGERNEQLDVGEGGRKRKLKHRVWWPANRTIPSKYAEYDHRGVWKVINVSGANIEIWRDYTKSERESMGEILDARYVIAKTFHTLAHDIATARFFDDIAKHQEWTWQHKDDPPNSTDATGHFAVHTYSNFDWVKVPETKIKGTRTPVYGKLAGKYIKAELWRDIQGIQSMQNRGWWDSVMRFFKVNKTARNPVVHMNNVMSNMALMDMIDVRVTDLFDGIREYKDGGEIYQDAVDHGVFGHSFVSREIRDEVLTPVLKQLIDKHDAESEKLNEVMAWSSFSHAIGKAADKIAKFDEKMISLYQLEDEIFRMATYMRRLSLGDTKAQAAHIAREQFLNYDIRAPWVNAARRTVLPFISYSYRAIPAIATSIAHRPWKLAKYVTVMYALNMLAYMATGDEDEEERERGAFDDSKSGLTWMGTPRMVRMPFRDDNENPMFLDVRRWVPAGDVFDMNQGAVPYMLAWLQMGGPLLIAAEIVTNRNTFLDRDIYSDLTDTNTEKAMKSAVYAVQSMIPSAPYIPGSHYFTQIMEAGFMGATDWRGIERDVTQSMLSSVGIKLQSVDVDSGYAWQQMAINQEQRALRQELIQLEKLYNRNKIFPWFYRRRRESLEGKMEALRERALELRDKKAS